jgi:hypothetical protein
MKTGLLTIPFLAVVLAAGCSSAPATTPATTPAPATTVTTSATPDPTTADAPSSPATTTPAASTATTTAPASTPVISIVQPEPNSYVVGTNEIKVVVEVSGFDLVDGTGRPNAPRQGHINYFMDTEPPTAPGRPATAKTGRYASSIATTYTWTNVVEGVHTFSAELVNNDDTPLAPPVTVTVTVSVYPG